MEQLLIFARHPEPGRVKTRLAAGVGDEKALEVYRLLLDRTQLAVTNCRAQATVWLAAPAQLPAAPDTPLWPGFEHRQQVAGDLGEKMRAAFQAAFDQSATAVVIIGTDCPQLTDGHLREAFGALLTHDVVLGPAADGGYYLLGMRRMQPAFFAGKRWSTESVLADTLADAQRLQLKVKLLPELLDIDTAADLAAWEQAEKAAQRQRPGTDAVR
ncbi:TIGR04282 family arsenosugar biosynthesis glycosyltransferase [Hymenobacter sp. BT175]|uniref:TIGR04282 family arsenosugar biosynthesis glycosyltransferase n=1 Tax=Hymenobacter translucens TaxID=2886507 RepID=UPI001D0EF4AE|nr:TIGR04282 family arsenosugar biosynthesis glycosyltransferase [Hymenobacter translucens]MCC2545139.1 TIGR04282 family arsenosugar biosynthesis glycosyltransferase [Hymenobacter translucens]